VLPREKVEGEARFLASVDVLVFVLDSQRERVEGNAAAIEQTKSNLLRLGRSPDRIDAVFLFNKRDLPNAALVDELRASIRWERWESVSVVAPTGQGFDELLRILDRTG